MNKKPYIKSMRRQKDFEAFMAWKSLSPLLRLSDKRELEKMGIEDPLNLFSIRTQKEFSKRFKISEHTISQWNEKIDLKMVHHEIYAWARKLSGNVLMALYVGIIAEGDASRVKLWMQLVEGWREKSEVVDPAASDELRKQTEFMRHLAERH